MIMKLLWHPTSKTDQNPFGSMLNQDQEQQYKTRATIPTLKKPDGSKATIPKEKANVLNDYFESVFTVENKDNVPRIRCHNVQDLTSVDITPESV